LVVVALSSKYLLPQSTDVFPTLSFNQSLPLPNVTVARPSFWNNAGKLVLVLIPPLAPDTINDPVITAAPTYGNAGEEGAYDADKAYEADVALEADIACDALIAQLAVPCKLPVNPLNRQYRRSRYVS
jgi:hypothetical protein